MRTEIKHFPEGTIQITELGNEVLSDQQAKIVELQARGYSNRDIAEYLGIKQTTVKRQLERVSKKLKKRGSRTDNDIKFDALTAGFIIVRVDE